jgi:uncharacterized protein
MAEKEPPQNRTPEEGLHDMQKYEDKLLFSASDLVNFLECEHLTTLDLINLDTPLPRAEDDEQAKLIQRKGFEHEESYLDRLSKTGTEVAQIESRDTQSAAEATRRAMEERAPVIYQACFRSPEFVGYVDFLRRVDIPSTLGDYSYEVVDTKLARSPKAKFIIQLCLYSDLLAETQEQLPRRVHLVLGDRTEESFRLADYYHYYRQVRTRFLEHVRRKGETTYPQPSQRCDLCHWRELCKERWVADDHLTQVANITKIQIEKLNANGVETLAQFAALDAETQVPGMHAATLERLRRQATLQVAKRESDNDLHELLETDPGELRGFRRLPRPDPGDLFFDMEGDPLEDDGLEYLFGVYYHDGNQPCFKDFWAHDRAEERQAFEEFMAFVMERLAQYPHMHIYHYAAYEETALKRLMSLHGTCEAEVDHLLRTERLVDLYKVVREGLLVSEPSYSIKNLETFYMEKREGEVTDAGASIIYYEHWKETRNPEFLKQIRDYNEFDCRSTYLLREWLLTLRPSDLPWFKESVEEETREEKSERVHEAEARLAEYRERLLGALPPDRAEWNDEAQTRELVFQLLDFHRRTAKPEWWAMFARQEMSEEELIDDPECIGAMWADPEHPPEPVKRSLLYTYHYPEQEFKLKVGDDCLRADTLGRAGRIEEIDEEARLLRIKLGTRNDPLPERLSVIPSGPIKTDVLREAAYRFADSVVAEDNRYKALKAILARNLPQIEGLTAGQPIVSAGKDLTQCVIQALKGLKNSYVFIQGPPGAGKTYTGSHAIVSLLADGYRVGVSSNSHKAINNLLEAVEHRAIDRGFSFEGVKKSSSSEDTCLNGRLIRDVTDRKAVIDSDAQLVAGTAWLFADPDLDQSFDYLFVDEAGQVSLANLVAMGVSARNIVLLGDQMQLQQPIKGVHPGQSGKSALDYLLQGKATIGEEEGVFLPSTWRMHKDVCSVISEAVYDGRLQPESRNQNQRLILGLYAHPELKTTGVQFVGVEHDGCSQRSEEEASVVCDIYQSLLGQRYVDREGTKHPITMDNVLVVAPYNMQVNLLKQRLPQGARVGTVDKFQGQEAEVVILSMATSSGDYLPRHIEFLYSKNRLNVALSRARCLALLVASPRLMAIRCTTVEQMALVNMLCWLHEYAGSCHSPRAQTTWTSGSI